MREAQAAPVNAPREATVDEHLELLINDTLEASALLRGAVHGKKKKPWITDVTWEVINCTRAARNRIAADIVQPFPMLGVLW